MTEYNNYAHLKNLDKPFDSNEKMQGFTEYSSLYSNKPYQTALYGKKITEPTFVGIPCRSTCYESLCALPPKVSNIDKNDGKPVFKEFNSMLIYKRYT